MGKEFFCCMNFFLSYFPYFKFSLLWINIFLGSVSFLRNCPPTPPLSQHFARSEKYISQVYSFAREMGQPCRRGATGESVVEFKFQRRSCKLYILPFPAPPPKRPGELARRLVSVLYIDRPLNPTGHRSIAKYSLQKSWRNQTARTM